MKKEIIPVGSKKHDVSGEIWDYGFHAKLLFSYDGKDLEIGLPPHKPLRSTWEEYGAAMIDTYIDRLHTPIESGKTMLHYWYVTATGEGEGKAITLHGRVTGHRKLPDSMEVHTSRVLSYILDYTSEELIATTKNTEYHCPLKYLDFREQDKTLPGSECIPDYEQIKHDYSGKIPYPEIEPGNVLVVLSNFDDFYFHSAFCQETAEDPPLRFNGTPHIGTFQDSFLISCRDGKADIDIRYFPHYKNIEMYSELTGDLPLYFENIGNSVLYTRTSAGRIRLEPGERKRVCEENAEDERIILPDGDLYPAGVDE